MKTKMRTLDPIPITRDGYETVQKEFDELTIARHAIVQRVKTAREYGDLSENAAYHAARQELFATDKRLRYLKMQLIYGKIVEAESGVIDLGCKVTVEVNGKEMEFYIVGPMEADPATKKLSTSSPIGKALIGRKLNENVSIDVPSGTVIYTIKKIS